MAFATRSDPRSGPRPASRPSPRHAAPSRLPVSEPGYRPDIQGLRAIAVGLVIVYHLYPTRLPGGFIGVDIFFVISGFLITGHLARSVERDGRVRLLDFWGRRARRLLPAAAIVLAVTWLVSRVVLPVTQLSTVADQVRASALYFQNWVLARDSVDYLAREDAPSPVQHFWSLSVEEQFYLGWPLLFVLAGAVTWAIRRTRRTGPAAGRAPGTGLPVRRVALVLAVALFAASFAYSVHETAGNPAAYFVTPTRVWELALGGIVALLPLRVAHVLGRIGVLAWLGLGAIVGTAVLLTDTSSFPGWIAAVPVCGAALLLACGSPRAKLSPAPLTSSRPFVFVGDISYSLYLWHWPIIVLWVAYTEGSIGRIDGPAILLASLVAAWLTTKLVEEPIRKWRLLRRRPTYSLATVATVLIPVLLVVFTSPSKPDELPATIDAAHPGAAQLQAPAQSQAKSGAPASKSVQAAQAAQPAQSSPSGYLPPLAAAPDDLSLTSGNGCQADTYDTKVKTCAFGDTLTPQRTVVLAGDSHAGQWSSALDKIGRERHWKIISVLHGSCRFGATLTLLDDKPFTACRDWNVSALQVVKKLKPDTVIMSERPNLGTPADPKPGAASWRQIGDGIVDYTSQLLALGIKTVAIRETPEIKQDVPDCLASRKGSIDTCGRSRAKAIQQDTPMVVAHDRLGSTLPLVDMNDLICGKQTCAPVVGNVIVYRDSHHLGRTYTLSLATFLADRLVRTGAMG